MSGAAALAVLFVVLIGPLAIAPIEHNVEVFFLVVGAVAIALAGTFDRRIAIEAIEHATPITIAVVAAGILFSWLKERFERWFHRIRSRVARPVLAGVAVVIIAALSSVITAIIAALVLAEVVEMLRLEPQARTNAAVAGCFAIGLGSALTPLGEPLATLASRSLGLPFFGLLRMLGPQVAPGVAVCGLLAGFLARGVATVARDELHVRESRRDAVVQGIKVFAFVIGLILLGEALGPIASGYVSRLSEPMLFWGNSISAALDNSTLVVLEVRGMAPERAHLALMSLLVAGGMLVPGNIPNIVCAGAMRIPSGAWARIGVPFGIFLMGMYFALFFLL